MSEANEANKFMIDHCGDFGGGGGVFIGTTPTALPQPPGAIKATWWQKGV